jgi:hypothetical protein
MTLSIVLKLFILLCISKKGGRIVQKALPIGLLVVILVVGLFAGLGVGLVVLPPKTIEKTETQTQLITSILTSVLTNTITNIQTSFETKTKLETQTLTQTYTAFSTIVETVQTGVAKEYRLGYKERGPLKILSSAGWQKGDTAYVFAEIQNTGSQNLQFVKVGIILFDQNSRAICADGRYSEIDVLLPNQKTPVFWLQLNMPYETYDIFIESWSETTKQPYREFRVENVKTWTDTLGYLHVVGDVVNTGTLTAKYVNVVVTFYDKEGKIVSAKSGYVTPSELGAGSRGSFDVYPDVGKEEIDHWSIQVCCSD